MTTITTINPATGEPITEHGAMGATKIDALRREVADSTVDWARRPLYDRAAGISALADTIELQRETLAQLVTQEVGKRVTESLAEVDKSVATIRWYVDHVEALFSGDIVDGPGARNEIRFEPLGALLAVMPWNFPIWQVVRFAAPALLAGNTILLKHAPNTTGCALAFEAAVERSGLPTGIFRALVVAPDDVPSVVEGLINDRSIAGVTFTGSSRAGRAVATVAGRALKKSLLELGGSDPFVVLADADLDRTVAAATASRFINCGQSCLAAKRFIVQRAVAAEFTDRFVAAVDELVLGAPTDIATTLGPMARDDLRISLADQVRRSVAAGATVASGDGPIGDEGWWYSPTVIIGAEADPDMAVMSEETFGPVAPIAIVDDEESAIELANRTSFGLGASVWGTDLDHAHRVGARLRSGALFVNAVVASDVRLPFGGVDDSGYGRELGSFGAHEFTNIRTVVTGATADRA